MKQSEPQKVAEIPNKLNHEWEPARFKPRQKGGEFL